MRPEKIMSMKNSNGTIGKRTRDLPACSAAPQPTAPPSAALNEIQFDEFESKLKIFPLPVDVDREN
jgi:hypothetical protein